MTPKAKHGALQLSWFLALGFGLSAFGGEAQGEGIVAPNIPLALASEAMNEAIRACGDKGYKVAASVVDLDGVIKVQARGDASPIHSQQFSFRKAFTIVSMGPMFGVDASSALVKTISASPQGLTNVQSGDTLLLFLPGAVLLKSVMTTIGAIGVSGAPSSLEDEACARSGVMKVQGQLDRLAK
jgi:uncharacterized protein GlcG (DUF336 family)